MPLSPFLNIKRINTSNFVHLDMFKLSRTLMGVPQWAWSRSLNIPLDSSIYNKNKQINCERKIIWNASKWNVTLTNVWIS